MNQLSNSEWWAAAATRALKTICQTAVALIGTSTYIQDVSWSLIFSASLLSGIMSILTSLAGLPEVGADVNE